MTDWFESSISAHEHMQLFQGIHECSPLQHSIHVTYNNWKLDAKRSFVGKLLYEASNEQSQMRSGQWWGEMNYDEFHQLIE